MRYIFRLTGKKNNKWYERLLSHHVCTKEDYEKFYPIQKIQESTLQNYLHPNSSQDFLCFDLPDDEPLQIYGYEADFDFWNLEMIFTPCNYLHKEVSDVGLEEAAGCISDKEE